MTDYRSLKCNKPCRNAEDSRVPITPHHSNRRHGNTFFNFFINCSRQPRDQRQTLDQRLQLKRYAENILIPAANFNAFPFKIFNQIHTVTYTIPSNQFNQI